MNLYKRALSLFLIGLALGCSNDDNSDIIVVPPRSLAEVAAEDDAAIVEYLQTHFYNYEAFDNPPADFDFKIVLDTIAGANADKIPLIDQVITQTRTVTSDEFLLEDEETTDHTFYYLIARQGIGETLPTVADSVYVRYRGNLLDGLTFDGSDNVPVWFDLAQLQGPRQGVRGFSEGTAFIQPGGNVVDNGDGTFTVDGYGIGMMFIPSGLGFFNTPSGAVPAYSPVIYQVEVFTINQTDHDGDGIPSILEDVNGNGYLYDDNTDLQDEEDSGQLIRFVDFLDPDDDQDGTPTSEEIEVDADGNFVSFRDSDNDMIPDHRDPDTN